MKKAFALTLAAMLTLCAFPVLAEEAATEAVTAEPSSSQRLKILEIRVAPSSKLYSVWT